jgi:heat shock protein HslJ
VLAFDRKRPPPVDPSLVDTEWMLISLQGEGLLDGSQITLNLGPVGYDGFSGCNRYGGEYEAADGGVLLTGEIMITEMECPTPELTDQEQTYVEALGNATGYRVMDDRLEIDDGAGETILTYVRKEEVSMDPANLLGTQWRLLSLNGSDLVEGSSITLAFHNEYRVSGYAGCRDYVATYQASGNDMGFVFFSMIEADCPMLEVLQEQEGQFTSALGWTSDYRLGEGRLEIVTERGEVLVFEALPEEANASLEGTPWSLIASVEERELEEMPVPHVMPMGRLAETQVTATFADGRVSGSAGCNRYQATYTVEGSSLVVEAPGATKMACLEPEGVMEQEQRYLDFLGDASAFHIYGNQLWLETGDGRALVFSTEVSSYGLTDLLDDLSAAGLTAKLTGQPADHGFAVEGRQVLVGGDTVSVYEFTDASAASTAAAGVIADSYSITVRRTEGDMTVETHSDWVETPHLFRKGRLIVITGDHPELLDVLESVLGPQFAGG